MPRIKKFDFKAYDLAKKTVIVLQGTSVVIPGFEQFHFVYHRWPDRKFNRISELQTSATIVYDARTKAAAIEEARKALNVCGEVGLRRRMNYARNNILGGEYLNELTGIQRELPF